MNKLVRGLLAVIIGTAVLVTLYAADEELVRRYLTAANEQLANRNYARAFSYVNTVLSAYTDESVPQNVEIMAENIYFEYLGQIRDSKDSRAFNVVKESLIVYPFLSSERISRLIRVINTQEAQDIAWGSSSGRTTEQTSIPGNNPVLYNTLELQLALEAVKQQAVESVMQREEGFQNELLDTQRQAYEQALMQARESASANNRLLLLSLLVLAGICFVIFIAVIINMIISIRNEKHQNQQFADTLRVVSELVRAPHETVRLDALPPVYNIDPAVRMIGSNVKGSGLPAPDLSDDEKKALNELAQKCKETGAQIDLKTNRKNNSKNVSELVYKIALEMNVPQYDASLFFSVAMVYDIGFLEVADSILAADHLSDDQKYEIRNHVKQGLAQISFVPEKYLPVFADGILMHHENMDGSGYPEGLQGAYIPLVARLIHVAESYVSLISKRNYREIYDKESAIAELRQKPGLYDQEIVDALDRII